MTKNSDLQVRESARELLGKILGFRDCSPQTIEGLIAAGSLCRLGKDEALVLRGQPFDALCLIVQGSLETRIINSDGHRHLITFLQPGDVAGIISILDGLGHVNDLIARSANTTVLRVPGSRVRELRDNDPTLGRAFELQLAFRSRLLLERLAVDSGMPIEVRVARLILMLASLHGEQRPGGVVLKIKISQADLADLIGVSRQSINAAIRQLTSQKAILVSYSKLAIVDVAQLRVLARH